MANFDLRMKEVVSETKKCFLIKGSQTALSCAEALQ